MHKEIIKNLKELGISHKEACVYLDLFKIGSQPIAVVARRLDLPRSTAQFLANSLAEKGFIKKTIKNNLTHYTAEDLNKINSILEKENKERQKQYENKKQSLEKTKKMLNSITNESIIHKPKIHFYEGFDGIARVCEDVLTAKEKVRSLVSYTKAHLSKPDKVIIYNRRAANGIFSACIMRDSKMARKRQNNNKAELRESIIVDAKKYNWSPEIQLYDNKVNIVSIDEKFGVIIESEPITQAMKVLFDLAWIGANQEKPKS